MRRESTGMSQFTGGLWSLAYFYSLCYRTPDLFNSLVKVFLTAWKMASCLGLISNG